MGFGEAVKNVYSNYIVFEGRASRSEFWWFTLFYNVVAIVLMVPLFATMPQQTLGGETTGGGLVFWVFGMLFILFAFGSILPAISVLVRRLHDQDKSGWWYWIVLVPFIGNLWLLVLMVLPGTEGRNRYGA